MHLKEGYLNPTWGAPGGRRERRGMANRPRGRSRVGPGPGDLAYIWISDDRKTGRSGGRCDDRSTLVNNAATPRTRARRSANAERAERTQHSQGRYREVIKPYGTHMNRQSGLRVDSHCPCGLRTPLSTCCTCTHISHVRFYRFARKHSDRTAPRARASLLLDCLGEARLGRGSAPLGLLDAITHGLLLGGATCQ